MKKIKIKPVKTIQPTKAISQTSQVNINYFIAVFIALSTVGSFPATGINFSDIYREVIAETGFVGLLAYWAYSNYNASQKTITLSAARLWFSALFIFASMSVLWSVNIDFFTSKYLLWVAATAVFLLALTIKVNLQTFISIARTLIFIATYISVIGILQTLFAINIFDQAAPPAANFVNKNMAAQTIVLIFPLLLFLILVDKNKKLTALYPFAITLILTYIFYTSTRAAWLSISLEVVLTIVTYFYCKGKLKQALTKKVFYWNKKQKSLIILAFTLFLLLINMSSNGFNFFFTTATEKIDDVVLNIQDKENVRYRALNSSLAMIKDKPFLGSGMGSFYYNGLDLTAELPTNINGLMRAHNDIAELGIELGFTGIILFFGVVFSLAMVILKLVRMNDIKFQLFYGMLATALSASFLNMQFSFPYQMPVPLMIFALYSGIIIKAGDLIDTSKIKTINISGQYWRTVVISIGLIFIGVVIINVSWLNVFQTINNNIKYHRWNDPIENNLFSCHRLSAKIISSIAKTHLYNSKDTSISGYKKPIMPLDSFNKCVKNTWYYNHMKANVFYNLKKYKKSTEFFLKAKSKSPANSYLDEMYTFRGMLLLGEKEKSIEIYDKLVTTLKTVEVPSRGHKKILRYLSIMSLNITKKEKAKEFYKEYLEHYEEDEFLNTYVLKK